MIHIAITPLRFIFWGGLICLLDINYSSVHNGYGFRFDLLNDVIGAAMIALGVFQLARLRLDRDPQNTARYDRGMAFVKFVAALCFLQSFADQFVFPLPAPVSILMLIWGLAKLAAVITFCVCMRWLSEDARLSRSAASWTTTTFLFVVFYAIPLGLLDLLSIGAVATAKQFHLDLGPGGLLAILVLLIPIIHLFISTSRMRNEIEKRGPETV